MPINRNGFARLPDLELIEMTDIYKDMEQCQASFVAQVPDVWQYPNLSLYADALSQWSRQWEYPFCFSHLPSTPAMVLDAGSGFTFFPFYLGEKGFQMHCCDSQIGLDDIFQKAQVAKKSHVQFKACSIGQLDYPSNFFDAVCCISVFEHMHEHHSALEEIWRVIKPGGRLILTCDVSLKRDWDMSYERFAYLLAQLHARFISALPLDISRTDTLLTTDYYRIHAPWRLPWRVPSPKNFGQRLLFKLRRVDAPFYSIAVAGFVFLKTV